MRDIAIGVKRVVKDLSSRKKIPMGVFALLLLSILAIYTATPSRTQAIEIIQSAWALNDFSKGGNLTDLLNWGDARGIDGQLTNSSDNISFLLYTKNSFGALWLGVEVQDFSETPAKLSICIDADNDEQWPEDLKQISTTGRQVDGYWEYNNIYFGEDRQKDFEGQWDSYDRFLGGTEVSCFFFAFEIPLTSSDRLYDLQIAEPEGTTLGLGLYLEPTNSTPFFWPNLTTMTDAADYAKLTLAGPGAIAPPNYKPEPVGGQTSVAPETTETDWWEKEEPKDLEAEEEDASGFTLLIAIGAIVMISVLIKGRKGRKSQ
ncbi:MAG: hypothetical protein ACFFB3_02200 [Candidatus Hodarchaeota archaeon]